MSGARERVKQNYPAVLEYDPDYIMLEVHSSPEKALSDPDQQLSFKEFGELIKREELINAKK